LLAHRALETDPAIGSLLPCNVVVRAHPEGGSEIIAADPNAMLGLADAAAAGCPGFGVSGDLGRTRQRTDGLSDQTAAWSPRVRYGGCGPGDV
jgi:hypothetical protein